MIKSIEIKNFKSIVDSSVDFGRVNIIIGENGCGKTNFLEAIAFASAASQDKLDNEVLTGKLRVASNEFMVPAFDDIDIDDANNSIINININSDGKIKTVTASSYSTKLNRWFNLGSTLDSFNTVKVLRRLASSDDSLLGTIAGDDSIDIKKIIDGLNNSDYLDIQDSVKDIVSKAQSMFVDKPELSQYTIYSPEETCLRKFNEETQVLPLGRRGEGLFQHLKQLSKTEDGRKIIEKIQNDLRILDWFDEVEIPNNLLSNEYVLSIGDRYLSDSLHYFDQRSTNEGFLYMLFYLTLFNSQQTPSFFAVDNIESSFNPKLCTRLIKKLIALAKENEKQIILTTHSPFVLDGLDLSDPQQRLFVASRNMDGHTVLRQVDYVADSKMKLSEVWMKGMIGGLPDNF